MFTGLKIKLRPLLKVQDRLEDCPVLPKPVARNSKDLLDDLTQRCKKNGTKSKESRELVELLSTPHLQALLESHDEVAKISAEPPPPRKQSESASSKSPSDLTSDGMTGEAIRMVGVRKKAGEPLGLTVSIYI